jgi:hypothetical protein
MVSDIQRSGCVEQVHCEDNAIESRHPLTVLIWSDDLTDQQHDTDQHYFIIIWSTALFGPSF